MKRAIFSFRQAIRLSDLANGWLYEAGIGENRAMLLGQSECLQVRVERHDADIRAGAVVDAKFSSQWVAGKSGIVTLDNGQQCLLQPLPEGLTEGAIVRVEIVRTAQAEKGGQSKRAKAKPAATGALLVNGPSLLERLEASGERLELVQAHRSDLLARHGWHEVMEQAETGHIDFEGGRLIISLTPAMTVIDVDGPITPLELAKRAAKQVALTLARLDITGSVGIDFPTLEAKADRAAVGDIFDDHMTTNCERTAINGFGLMQVVMKKTGPSILEIVQTNNILEASLQLLRQAERESGTGGVRLIAHPAVAAILEDRTDWLEELGRRTGRTVSVEAKGSISINGGQIASN